MKFWKSKAMLLAVLGAVLLVMAVAWLCFYHAGEPKDPDGTLVRQEFRGMEPAEWKSDWWRSVNRTPEFLRIREVAA